MSYQTHKNGQVITWPDSSDFESLSISISQLQLALTTLQNKVSAEADQQDNYYGRNIKTITVSPGSNVLSPLLDDTNIKIMSEVKNSSAKVYLENLQGVFLNCYYFISNAATCDKTWVSDIRTNFNSYGDVTTGPYYITIAEKVHNNYSAGQGILLRTNVPTRNNKQYNELDEMISNVDTFFMEDYKTNFEIPRIRGIYELPKATSNGVNITDYNVACDQDMPVLTVNRFIDISRCLDPFDETIVKFSGTVTIDRFKLNHYCKTYKCTYNKTTYKAISSHSQPNVDLSTSYDYNLDPYLILRQNITKYEVYISSVKYYFPTYRKTSPPIKADPDYEWTEADGTGRKWKSTAGSLVDLEMVPSNDLKIFNHIELPNVIYQRTVIKGTNDPATASTPIEDREIVTIPYSAYDKIIVTIVNKYEENKIKCNPSGTIYVTQDLYNNISFCYNYNTDDVVTRTVNDVYQVTDNYTTINSLYYLVFETMQEAVGKKAYRIYCNINFDVENFIAHGDYKTYDPTGSLSQSIVSASVRVIPTSTMLYGDQPCGTIYTRPITLSSEAIKKFSLYCQLYKNDINSILEKTTNNGSETVDYYLKTYVAFDKRIKSRKNITLYVKTPLLYFDDRYYHGQRHRATSVAETTSYDSTNSNTNPCFYYNAQKLRPFIYRKHANHPEQLALALNNGNYECNLKRVQVILQNSVNNISTVYANIDIYPKKMTITCKTSASINQSATLQSYITRTVDGSTATYTIASTDSHTFFQTYQQADGYDDHRYYYNIICEATGITVKSSGASWATLSCSHVTGLNTYNHGVITPTVRYTIPLYVFGRLSDAGNINVLVDSEEVKMLPLNNVDNTSIIVSLQKNGEVYTYESVKYTPEAQCTAIITANSTYDTINFSITEQDDRNKIVNEILGTLKKATTNTVQSSTSSITIKMTTNGETETITQNPTGTYTTETNSAQVQLDEQNDFKFILDITKDNATCTIQNNKDGVISFKEFQVIRSSGKLDTITFWKEYHRGIIPRIVGYDSSGLEVSNWLFYNGFDFDYNSKEQTNTSRLNGIIFNHSIAQDEKVNVIVSYNYYEDICSKEQWKEMTMDHNLMYLDNSFSKTTSSYTVEDDNLQSAKCKIELTSANNVQYIMYTCRNLEVHNIYVDNDNLENINAIKPQGQTEAGYFYLANSTQRLAGKQYIESNTASKEISFLANAAKVYALPKILNIITGQWEIPPRSTRQTTDKITEDKLNKSYYIAIEDYIQPVITTVNKKGVITSEINHLTATGDDHIDPVVIRVYSWSSYSSATSQDVQLRPFDIEQLRNPTSTVQSDGGYCWDFSRMLISVLPPKNKRLDSMYYRHLIPYNKAQQFFTAMQKPKYYCFVPTETATESVWEAVTIVSEATDEQEAVTQTVLDFKPIVSVNATKDTEQRPRYLPAAYAVEGDFKTIGICFTWQDIPNIAGLNMAWTTKVLNTTPQTEEEEKE